MINYIIYGNTDYLDVLQIQTDYMSGRGHLTLFLNSNDLDLEKLYEKYNRVIFYNGNDQYANRLLTCLEKIEDEYFLLLHDIDVLLDVEVKTIEKFYEFLKHNDFDRIDLKYSDKINGNLLIKVDKNIDVSEWEVMLREELTDGICLVRQTDPNNYIYNVNPSIWKKESFIKLLTNFKHKNYRTIEEMDVQIFAKQFKIFKLYSENKLDCGYFQCLNLFKFLHISHSGKLLLLNDSYVTNYNQSYKDVSDEYIKIVNNYDLKKSNKWVI